MSIEQITHTENVVVVDIDKIKCVCFNKIVLFQMKMDVYCVVISCQCGNSVEVVIIACVLLGVQHVQRSQFTKKYDSFIFDKNVRHRNSESSPSFSIVAANCLSIVEKCKHCKSLHFRLIDVTACTYSAIYGPVCSYQVIIVYYRLVEIVHQHCMESNKMFCERNRKKRHK